jgi:hypothetical protein
MVYCGILSLVIPSSAMWWIVCIHVCVVLYAFLAMFRPLHYIWIRRHQRWRPYHGLPMVDANIAVRAGCMWTVGAALSVYAIADAGGRMTTFHWVVLCVSAFGVTTMEVGALVCNHLFARESMAIARADYLLYIDEGASLPMPITVPTPSPVRALAPITAPATLPSEHGSSDEGPFDSVPIQDTTSVADDEDDARLY